MTSHDTIAVEPSARSKQTLQPLKGEVCEQFVRCGKRGCRCENGQLHGPYYYRVWREGRVVKKVYVKREQLEAVQEACRTYREYEELLDQQRQMRAGLSKSIERTWRKTESLLRKPRPATRPRRGALDAVSPDARLPDAA